MRHTKFIRELPLHIMLLPAIVLIIIYSYIPMIGICIAFQDFNPAKGLFGSEYIGLDNFKYIFKMPDTLQVLWNTVFIAFLKIIGMLIIPVTFALLLNEVRISWAKRTLQTIIYIPNFLSWVIMGAIFIDILSPSNGIVGKGLMLLGIKPIFFLGDPEIFPFTIVFTDIWKSFGFGTVIYIASISGIDPTLYEAVVIDGANHWKRVKHITLPGMKPIIVLMTVLSLGNILNAGFEQVFNLYGPAVYKTGDILDTMVYRIGLQQGLYAPATVIGFFKSIVSLVFISVSYWLADKVAHYRVF